MTRRSTSNKITSVRQIGNVDLMLDGIDVALRVRANRVSPERVSSGAGKKLGKNEKGLLASVEQDSVNLRGFSEPNPLVGRP